MKFLFITFLLVVLVSGCTQEVLDPNSTKKNLDERPVIVAFGNSLTYGYQVEREDSYPSQLEVMLLENGYNWSVINSGLSGETSSGALSRVEWVLTLEPDIVILTIGANDGLRGIDLDVTKNNIENIIQKFLNNNVTVVFSGMQIVENLGERYISEFEAMYPKIAQNYDVVFIPFFLKGVAGVQELNLKDEIHPNRKGYEKIVKENVYFKVVEAIERR